ncbi:MAG: V-type ATP synthase subunit F [Phycisphaerae bacterium]|nr:V-type ATP synthase subunit F [Phycisphaerae bacterium]MDD5380812.1 V-type ATP synthase subunit F [Phycisphaerae bacterium]
MKGNVAVLGDADFVMPFSALGVDTYPVGQTAEQMRESADKIVSDKYALVVVAENIAPKVEEIFAAYQGAPTPCIVVVPFTTEPAGVATRTLGKAIKMAAGINILQND